MRTGQRSEWQVLTATALVCAVAFAVLLWIVVADAPVTGLDHRVEDFAVGHRAGWSDALFETWTRLGSTVVIVPVLLLVSLCLLLAPRRDVFGVVLLWVACGGSMVLYQVFKGLVGRPRPPVAEMLTPTGGYAFPSGHSTQAVVVWGLLAAFAVSGPWRTTRRFRVPVLCAAAVVILLIGLSRIYLGVHWVTDVAGGFALGGAWLALLLAARSRRQRRRAANPSGQ